MRAQSVTRYSAFARVGLALRRHQSTSWTRRRRVWVESGRSRRVIFTARARCVFRGAFLACSPSSLVVMRPVAQEGGICVWGLRPKFNSTFTVLVATAAIATATIAAALAAAALTVAVAAAIAAFPAPPPSPRHRRRRLDMVAWSLQGLRRPATACTATHTHAEPPWRDLTTLGKLSESTGEAARDAVACLYGAARTIAY